MSFLTEKKVTSTRHYIEALDKLLQPLDGVTSQSSMNVSALNFVYVYGIKLLQAAITKIAEEFEKLAPSPSEDTETRPRHDSKGSSDGSVSSDKPTAQVFPDELDNYRHMYTSQIMFRVRRFQRDVERAADTNTLMNVLFELQQFVDTVLTNLQNTRSSLFTPAAIAERKKRCEVAGFCHAPCTPGSGFLSAKCTYSSKVGAVCTQREALPSLAQFTGVSDISDTVDPLPGFDWQYS